MINMEERSPVRAAPEPGVRHFSTCDLPRPGEALETLNNSNYKKGYKNIYKLQLQKRYTATQPITRTSAARSVEVTLPRTSAIDPGDRLLTKGGCPPGFMPRPQRPAKAYAELSTLPNTLDCSGTTMRNPVIIRQKALVAVRNIYNAGPHCNVGLQRAHMVGTASSANLHALATALPSRTHAFATGQNRNAAPRPRPPAPHA